METSVMTKGVYVPSDDVVAREIAGELIIIPLVSGLGDLEDELFSLNDIGRAIWDELDGKNDIHGVAQALSLEYSASAEEIEQDVLGLVHELFVRGIVVEAVRA